MQAPAQQGGWRGAPRQSHAQFVSVAGAVPAQGVPGGGSLSPPAYGAPGVQPPPAYTKAPASYRGAPQYQTMQGGYGGAPQYSAPNPEHPIIGMQSVMPQQKMVSSPSYVPGQRTHGQMDRDAKKDGLAGFLCCCCCVGC